MGLVGIVQCFRGFLTGISGLRRVVGSLEVLNGVVDRLEGLMEMVHGQRRLSGLVGWLQRMLDFSETQSIFHSLRRLMFLCFQVYMSLLVWLLVMLII